ncbi:MAG: hypothetical protein ACOVSR_09765 [Bacteroidia bacterium]
MKLEFKGTKGKWSTGKELLTSIVDEKGVAVLSSKNSDEVVIANKFLIASAPDLLEALQNMVKLFEVRSDLTFEQRMSIDISTKAIEKALK